MLEYPPCLKNTFNKFHERGDLNRGELISNLSLKRGLTIEGLLEKKGPIELYGTVIPYQTNLPISLNISDFDNTFHICFYW